MKAESFCYWLQGFLEIADAHPKAGEYHIHADQVKTIKAHLAMVFKHEIDPSMGTPEHRDALQELHDKAKMQPPQPPKKKPGGGGDGFRGGCSHDIKLMC